MVFLLCLMIHSGTVPCSLLGVSEAWLYTTVILVQVSINRYTMDWAAYTISIDFAQFWRLGSLRLGVSRSVCGEDLFPGFEWAPSHFLLNVMVSWVRGSKVSHVFSYKDTNFIHEGSPLWPNYLPEASTWNTSHWGLGMLACCSP